MAVSTNRWIAVLWMLTVTLALAGPALAGSVKYDVDRSADFSSAKTVAWTSESGELSIAERRIVDAIETGFAGRGYTFTRNGAEADFLVRYRAVAWQDRRLAGGWRGPAWGHDVRLERQAMGTLVIDVYEAKSGRLAWHGLVTDALAGDPEQADRKTAKAVEKLLRKFPARGGKK
jgi:hypothetical protein